MQCQKLMNNINFSKNGKAPVSIYISSEIKNAYVKVRALTNLYSVAVNESMIRNNASSH